jgi:HD-GYP domain-containing protein (c-di-GMP phosphodiesterase class II)
VALNAVLVGEALGLSRGRLRGLALGGLLHDIGKLGVPVPILQKPGALDPAERKAIERHPALGAAMLDQLGGFGRDVRSLVLDHHERPDGDGYPRGLANDELSLDARIMAVCDVFDALVSDRPYRAAWPVEQALETLREGAGTQFDARCVQALTDIVQPSRREEAA